METLEQARICLIEAVSAQCVATGISMSAGTSHHVLCIWIQDHVSDSRGIAKSNALTERVNRSNAAGRSLNAVLIDDGSITDRIKVQIRILARLCSNRLP